MTLNLDLKREKKTKGEAVLKKERDKQFQPTWNEIWFTGYTRPTGSRKSGIFQTKLTERDKDKLEQVKKAIEQGVIGTQVEDMKKFTKTHALRLFKHLKEVTRDKIIEEMVKNKPANYHCVLNLDTFNGMVYKITQEPFIGLDTETTGVDVFGHDFIVGLSISCPTFDDHFYIPVRHNVPEEQLDAELVFPLLKRFFESPKIGKILHNAKFDAHMFRKEGITLQGIIMDTMISMHVLNENEPSYALKKLATKWGKHFGFEDKSATYEELFGKGGFQDTPLNIATIYACKDTHLVVEFYKFILSHLEKQEGLMNTHLLETEILKVVIEMEKNGFYIDLDYAERYKTQLEDRLKELDGILRSYFGDINLNSPEQLKRKLFIEMGLPDRNNGSVDAGTLEKLKEDHEGVAFLLEYRELSKLYGTYIEPLPQKVSSLDGRLHGQFKQSGTVTGRFSSSNPNLQNIPPEARGIFTSPKGKVMMGCDFSKVEPTILADMTQDEHFLEPFKKGIDIYSSLASKTFDLPYEECGDGTKVRKMMKTGLLATMYGTTMFTLAQQLKITVEEAENFINKFLSSYDVVANWIKSVHNQVDSKGFVVTMFGRKRRFLGHTKRAKRFKKIEDKVVQILGRKPNNIWQEEKIPYKLKKQYWDVAGAYFKVQRQSVNAIIQGTGAEIMKKALVRVYDLFMEWNQEAGFDLFKILGTVHDEILMEVPEDITVEQVEAIEDAMINCVQMSLPLKVDTELMYRWGEGVSKDEWFKKIA